MKKVIVVTGASSGLGLSLAIKLAKQGNCVYATMRDLAKRDAVLKAADESGVKLIVKELDVEDTSSVNACIAAIMAEEGRIDCLVNNAGMGFIKSTEQASEEEIQRILNTNFMGVVRCVKAVLPHMRQARSGHIINISSVGGLVGQPFNEIYCASKFALEGYTESMATYIQPAFNIKFSLIEPGGITSEFANNIYARLGSKRETEDEYDPILNQYLAGARSRANNADGRSVYQSPDEVAECIVDVIYSKNPPLRIRSSDWANSFCQLKTQADPDGSQLTNAVRSLFFERDMS